MKKIIYLFLTILTIFTLCGCNDSKKKADYYENVTLEFSEADRISAAKKAEDSLVILCASYAKLYKYSQAFVYKYSNGYYYGLSIYIDDMESYSLNVFFDDTKISASLLGYDTVNNLSCFRFKYDQDIGILEIKEDSCTDVGQQVFSIGSPQQKNINSTYESDFYNTVYNGVISLYDGRLLKHTALPSIDYIGSPLVDYNGNLIGINVSRDTTDDYFGFNYALSSEILYSIIDDLESANGRKINRVNFEITASEYIYINGIDEQIYDLPLGVTYALCVKNIYATNSYFGLIKTGDLIVSVNGNIIKCPSDLTNYISLSKSGSTTIEFYRLSSNGYELKSVKK